MADIVQFQVCRVAYCTDCAKRGDPHFGQWYAVFGTHYQCYYFGFSRHDASKMLAGFTPHLFIKEKTSDGVIFYDRICMMNNCGIEIRPAKGKILLDATQDFMFEQKLDGKPLYYKDLQFDILKYISSTMNLKDWNALVSQFKGWTGYRIS